MRRLSSFLWEHHNETLNHILAEEGDRVVTDICINPALYWFIALYAVMMTVVALIDFEDAEK